ncbi:hypothetical protein JOF41_007301 [Saccharothrix coeruleofusca]|uniref:ERF family protein n=1 Tax=Saccharothrix coeruleofusca TaxID=33919 RepID=UPI001AE59A9C|nr:ERF family protein [Saccharothrix coeruleofusca]MBP2341047.1 hypothetical protein [Saccharothrix coeruleofusca]
MTAPQSKVLAAVLAVMKDVGAIGKTDENKHFGFKFRGIDTVLDRVAPLLRDHGVLTRPELRNLQHFPIGKDGSKVIVTVAYDFTHAESGETWTAVVPGEANDQQDKATSKAMSVAYRTALLQALAIATGERDPHAGPPVGRRLLQLQQQVKMAGAKKGLESFQQLRDDYALWSQGADIEAADEKDLGEYLKHLDPSTHTTVQRTRNGARR